MNDLLKSLRPTNIAVSVFPFLLFYLSPLPFFIPAAPLSPPLCHFRCRLAIAVTCAITPRDCRCRRAAASLPSPRPYLSFDRRWHRLAAVAVPAPLPLRRCCRRRRITATPASLRLWHCWPRHPLPCRVQYFAATGVLPLRRRRRRFAAVALSPLPPCRRRPFAAAAVSPLPFCRRRRDAATALLSLPLCRRRCRVAAIAMSLLPPRYCRRRCPVIIASLPPLHHGRCCCDAAADAPSVLRGCRRKTKPPVDFGFGAFWFDLIITYSEAGVGHADLLYSYMKRRKTLKGIKTFLLLLVNLLPS